MGVDLYTSLQKYHCFWLEKRGSTYTRIDLYTRKYDIITVCILQMVPTVLEMTTTVINAIGHLQKGT